MKILLSGYSGFMGREVQKVAQKGLYDLEVAGGVDPSLQGQAPVPVAKSFQEAARLFAETEADCIIDFSNHRAAPELTAFAAAKQLPLVIATTGHTEEELAAIHQAAQQIPVFFSANMSLGVALLVKMAKIAAAALPEAEIEIIEKHHDRKLDAPSGTAMMLANEIKTVRPESFAVCGRSGHGQRTREEIGIHAIRMGNVVGEHEVILCTGTQTISLKHEAHDRGLFAEGAAAAAAFLVKQPAGLYDMHSLLAD